MPSGIPPELRAEFERRPAPRIGIGLPVYNGAEFLAEALDALLAQTYQDFEIIISDNASTDATPEIVREYATRDARIIYTRNEENIGASRNFTKTFELSRSEYFKWAAADDLYAPRFLEECVAALDRRPEAILAYSRTALIDADSRLLYHFEDGQQLASWSTQTLARGRQALGALLRDGTVANVLVFGLIRSDALRQVRPLGSYFGADLVLVEELALSGQIIELPGTMSFLRRHPGSSSTYERTPSAAEQQQFYDPSVTGRLRIEWQLRRRYLEAARVVARAPIKLHERVALELYLAWSIVRRAAWRLEFEARSRLGRLPTPRRTPIGDHGAAPHWTEL